MNLELNKNSDVEDYDSSREQEIESEEMRPNLMSPRLVSAVHTEAIIFTHIYEIWT